MLLTRNWILMGSLGLLLVGCGVDVEQTKVPGSKSDDKSQTTEPEAGTCNNTEAPYNGMDVSDCIAAIFQCADDEKRFDDECGCGCEKLASPSPSPPACDYADPDKRYTQTDISQCAAALFNCPAEDEKRFDDECGCGCEKTETPSCDDPSRQYHARSMSDCLAMLTSECASGTWFEDVCGCGCEGLPAITTDKKAYQLGENIEVTITNGTGKDIFLEGCNQFWLEISKPAGWEKVGGNPCFWEGYAKLVSDQQQIFATQSFSAHTPGTYRITAKYSESCSSTLTLSNPTCAPLHVATSASFTVQ